MSNNIINNQVKPYSLGKAALIVIALTVLDTFGCVVLLIGSYIYMKKGQTGLAMALCVTNLLIPDALPVADEIFQLIAVGMPLYQSYKEGKSAGVAVNNAIESYKGYNSAKEMDGMDLLQETLHTNGNPEPVLISQEDSIEQIKRLNGLKESGIITEEEFQAKKRELLEKM
ncbi:MAG: SHOCT domain-containing protein [Ruminococcus sp.]|nr:SHOCT domain-containing protein [Ruminococcus sp.]